MLIGRTTMFWQDKNSTIVQLSSFTSYRSSQGWLTDHFVYSSVAINLSYIMEARSSVNITSEKNHTFSVQRESCYYLDRFQIFHSGPPTTEYIVNCTLNAILAIVAIFGNGIILHAIRKSAALRPPSRALLCSLAASDFGVGLIVQPFYVLYKTAELKNNHLLYCIGGIGFHLSANVLSAVSFLTVTAIAIDRVLALLLTTRYQTTVSLRRVIKVLLTIWALTGLWVFNWIWNKETYQVFNIIVISVCLLVCSVSYITLWVTLSQLRKKTVSKEANNARSRKFGAYKRSVTNMFCVYALMLVCYVPYLAMFFVIQTTKVNSTKMLALSYTMTVLFANSAINPFLYCWRIREIRSEVLLTLTKFACKSAE